MFRGIPPNGKLFSLIDSIIEQDLMMGEIYSLELEKFSWITTSMETQSSQTVTDAHERAVQKYKKDGNLFLTLNVVYRQGCLTI